MSDEIYQAKLALYEALIATHPEVERKGSTTPYTSLNGNMFSFLTEDGQVGLRLSEADREAFAKKYETGPIERQGTVMPDYVAVPDALLENTAELAPYLAASYEYIKTVPLRQVQRFDE